MAYETLSKGKTRPSGEIARQYIKRAPTPPKMKKKKCNCPIRKKKAKLTAAYREKGRDKSGAVCSFGNTACNIAYMAS